MTTVRSVVKILSPILGINLSQLFKAINEDYPQLQAGKNKTMVLIPTDHKRLMLERIEVLDALNEDIGGEKKTFDVIRDLNSKEVQSFQFRMECNFYRDYFMLYPPKKNLEVNLRNHANGLKHSKILDGHLLKTKAQPFLVGSKEGQQNQPQLRS